jgi:HPt (histidine-containing phosphotransfer) domain-containing protein
METSGQPQLAEALKLLWQKFLPQMQERIAVLEEASSALEAGSLSAGQRAAAAAAAHKLAGVLGTFGLAEGTDIAREVEGIYTSDAPLDSVSRTRLGLRSQQLATLIKAYR